MAPRRRKRPSNRPNTLGYDFYAEMHDTKTITLQDIGISATRSLRPVSITVDVSCAPLAPPSQVNEFWPTFSISLTSTVENDILALSKPVTLGPVSKRVTLRSPACPYGDYDTTRSRFASFLCYGSSAKALNITLAGSVIFQFSAHKVQSKVSNIHRALFALPEKEDEKEVSFEVM